MNFRVFFAAFFLTTTICAQDLNRVVAIVNKEVITQSELQSEMTKASAQMAASHAPNAIDHAKLREMVLQKLIDEKLMEQLAAAAKITVTNAQVMTAIQHIAEQNHFTVDQLKQALSQQGMSFDQYQKMIHQQLIIHQVQQSAIGNEVRVTPADLAEAKLRVQQQNKFMRQYNVLDAVYPTQEKAQSMIATLKSGKNTDGNDLGWQGMNTLPSLFTDELAHMSAGDIAGPIKAPNGYHIIKLIAVRGGTQGPVTDKQLHDIAYQIAFQKAADKWIKILRKTAYVNVLGS